MTYLLSCLLLSTYCFVVINACRMPWISLITTTWHRGDVIEVFIILHQIYGGILQLSKKITTEN